MVRHLGYNKVRNYIKYSIELYDMASLRFHDFSITEPATLSLDVSIGFGAQ